MDEKNLIDAVFENLPGEMAENVLMFMDIGTVLYLCTTNDPLNKICTEKFWEMKVGGTYRRRSKAGWPTWEDMALALYIRSLENRNQCFECSQYVGDEIRQCEDCGVDLCMLCGDSEINLCMDCKEVESDA